MAGVHFAYNNFPSLLQLNMGIADRLDDNRAESFTILYCNFQKVEDTLIIESLEKVLRGSDVVVNSDKEYFFILPYTDKYGATIVKNMFEEFFDLYIPAYEASYPLNGETPEELLQSLQAGIKKRLNTYLECLDF